MPDIDHKMFFSEYEFVQVSFSKYREYFIMLESRISIHDHRYLGIAL